MNKHILILRLDSIGDFILFTSALPYFRELYRDDRVVLALQPLVAPLAESCPYVDEIITIDPVRYASDSLYRNNIVNNLVNKFDVAINTVYSRTWQSDNIIARTHAPVKIGFECFDNDTHKDHRRKEQELYTTLVPAEKEWMYEIERYERLFHILGKEAKLEYLNPELWINKEDKKRVQELLSDSLTDSQKFVVLCPSAAFKEKFWFNESFALVADNLIKNNELAVVLAGSKKDTEQALAIKSIMKENMVDFTGKLSLREFAALMEQAALYVGIDTAGFHMAWTLGVPAVGIFGGGHFGRFTPPDCSHIRIVNTPMDCYNCYWHCIYDEIKCITTITPQMVMDAVNKLLPLVDSRKKEMVT